jgi:glycerol-3-phosphate dehydrogenase (NAD(P)+)
VNSAKDSNTRLAVIGGGSWGTTLASLVSRNAQVTLWARDAGVVREINDTHTHARYLEGLSLNPLLRATTDLEAALSNAHAVFVAIPRICSEAYLNAWHRRSLLESPLSA